MEEGRGYLPLTGGLNSLQAFQMSNSIGFNQMLNAFPLHEKSRDNKDTANITRYYLDRREEEPITDSTKKG